MNRGPKLNPVYMSSCNKLLHHGEMRMCCSEYRLTSCVLQVVQEWNYYKLSNFSGFRDRFIYICKQLFFRKQLNRGIIIIFASERDIHFCVIDDQATVDCYRIPSLLPSAASLLSTVFCQTCPNG
uniref:Uncharacterized protein n=1 Tax=Romanomermis culicivorax TaxID=13658 RepID=A0A915HUX9_ROMCU